MTKPPLTSDGTPRLSELARHVVVPSGIVSTGWPAVRDKCAELGISFDAWQDGAGRLILAKREDGMYATTVGGVVISIPRQVGKTFLLGAIVFALCLLFPNLTVIWTAHRLRTAAETFSAMQGMTRRAKIKPFVSKVVLGSGDEEIQFHNGSRILFGARERGFGRGFAGVDVLVFDEAQILTENAIDDMVPATNQAPNPLILFTGTPPKRSDPGDVFRMKRTEALSGESEDTVYIEFSADLGADPLDREQWRKANPSHPARTSASAMLRMRKNLSEESFVREALGIWEDKTATGGVVDLDSWSDLHEPESVLQDPVTFSVEIPLDRSRAFIGSAGPSSVFGRAQVEIAKTDPGTAWVIPWLVRNQARAVVIDGGNEAASLIPALEQAGLTVQKVNGAERAQACGAFYDAAVQGGIAHLDDPDISSALTSAVWKENEGSRAFSRRRSAGDISALYAVTLALHGHLTRPVSVAGYKTIDEILGGSDDID